MQGTLLIVEDDAPTVRCYERMFSQQEPELAIVYARDVAEGRAAFQTLDSSEPPLRAAVLDLRLPDGRGDDLAHWMLRFSPRTPIIVASAYLDAAVAVDLQLAGVMVLPKPVTPEVLREAVHLRLSEVDRLARLVDEFAERHSLSRRQREVLDGLVDGRSSKDIAARLGVSVNTVGLHARRIFAKTGCRSRSALVRAALGHGVLFASPPPQRSTGRAHNAGSSGGWPDSGWRPGLRKRSSRGRDRRR